MIQFFRRCKPRYKSDVACDCHGEGVYGGLNLTGWRGSLKQGFDKGVGDLFAVVTGDPKEIADEMLTNPDIDLVTFTGGVPIGKYIAARAVYKRQVLELGCGALVIPEQVTVFRASEAFDEMDNLKEERAAASLKRVTQRLADTAREMA